MQLLCCGCEYSPNSDNLHVDFTQGALGLGSRILTKSFFSLLIVTSKRMQSHKPSHRSWNRTVDDFFPYQDLERDPEKLLRLLDRHEILENKVRDLSIGDILRLSPNATRKKGRRLGYDEDEFDDSVWPLPPLAGCPQEGVLTMEPAGHLGTMMTQLATLYALSR